MATGVGPAGADGRHNEAALIVRKAGPVVTDQGNL